MSKNAFFAGLIVAASGLVSPPVALVAGLVYGFSFIHPYHLDAKRLSKLLLQVSVIGLGFGMNLQEVLRAGRSGFMYTALSITFAMLLGWGLGKMLAVKQSISFLISAGTAICGGSAIAAIAPISNASEEEIAISLGTVFVLNSIALLTFPAIGTMLHMTQTQFGLWAALAIHDTSSVVGAAMQYGARALEIATTIKLTRALWIVPVTLVIGMLWNRGSEEKGAGKAKRPWFILGFLAAAAIVTWIPALKPAGHGVFVGAQRSLVVTLFLIGSGLSRQALQVVGRRPLIQGFLLWVIMGCGTLGAILLGWIG